MSYGAMGKEKERKEKKNRIFCFCVLSICCMTLLMAPVRYTGCYLTRVVGWGGGRSHDRSSLREGVVARTLNSRIGKTNRGSRFSVCIAREDVDYCVPP